MTCNGVGEFDDKSRVSQVNSGFYSNVNFSASQIRGNNFFCEIASFSKIRKLWVPVLILRSHPIQLDMTAFFIMIWFETRILSRPL